MKKHYIAPALCVEHTTVENIIALSLVGGTADDSDALVKGNNDWDIWGNNSDDDSED